MINYDVLAEARAEYEASLGIEARIKALRERYVSHRRTAIRLYKSAGLSNADIRRIMLIGDKDD